ncbi:MAG: AbgT family transporter [Pseudomonadota bacterium]
MTTNTEEIEPKPTNRLIAFIEKAGSKVPDPIIIFIYFFVFSFILTVFIGGLSFQTQSADGTAITHVIKNMADTEHVRWLFDNAILKNWLAFGNGVLGVILIVMLGVGVAENSGLFATVLKKLGTKLSDKFLTPALIFLGIMSSIASDAGYLVLIPLAGLLFAGLGKHPLIGMAAAFAGVSAGFSANLIPATPIDVIIGLNAQAFAEAQGVPFETASGETLTPATMHYYFIFASTFLLVILGTWVSNRFVAPRLENQSYELPDGLDLSDFSVSEQEQKGLKASFWGLIASLAVIGLLAIGPLAPFENDKGQTIKPLLDNVILLISFVFIAVGAAFGVASGKFKNLMDIVQAMISQMNAMGYILVLTFFSYNFLGLLSYSGLGTYITYLGVTFLQWLGVQDFPILLIVSFIFTTAIINLFVGGLTSKWMLLGPVFIPMLYQVNPAMTPDLVAAAYRVADSATNIITPMMIYSGIILAFIRKYKPNFAFGELIIIMLPYSFVFLIFWTLLLIGFFALGIPLGF